MEKMKRWFRRNFAYTGKHPTYERKSKLISATYWVNEFSFAAVHDYIAKVNAEAVTIEGVVYDPEMLIVAQISSTPREDLFVSVTVEFSYCGISWQLFPKPMFWGWMRWMRCYHWHTKVEQKIYVEIDVQNLITHLEKLEKECANDPHWLKGDLTASKLRMRMKKIGYLGITAEEVVEGWRKFRMADDERGLDE